jgi:LPXTG-motif cell wall-anchored protein
VIGFCNQAGQPITQGNLSTTPFVWRAVSSQAAEAPYNGPGHSAILYAYQPRQGVDPGQWSGEELTAAATYTDPAHPMAAATDRDESLQDFVQDYPPMWDGLVQVRMYLGASNQTIDSLSYPATVLQVTGNTWHVVSGGNVSCQSGKAVSIETILLPKSKSTPKAHASGTPAAHSSSGAVASSAPTNSSSPAAGGAAGGSGTHLSANSSTTGSDSNTSTVVGVLITALVLLAASGFVVSRRRQRRLSPSSPESFIHSTSEKGR